MKNRDWLFINENKIHNFRSAGVLLNEGIFNSLETDESRLIFKWADINELQSYNIYPIFLKEKVNNLSDEIEHFVSRD